VWGALCASMGRATDQYAAITQANYVRRCPVAAVHCMQAAT